jgi:hypothetical protein
MNDDELKSETSYLLPNNHPLGKDLEEAWRGSYPYTLGYGEGQKQAIQQVLEIIEKLQAEPECKSVQEKFGFNLAKSMALSALEKVRKEK